MNRQLPAAYIDRGVVRDFKVRNQYSRLDFLFRTRSDLSSEYITEQAPGMRIFLSCGSAP